MAMSVIAVMTCQESSQQATMNVICHAAGMLPRNVVVHGDYQLKKSLFTTPTINQSELTNLCSDLFTINIIFQ